jgi:hypothetical protein
MGQSFLESAHLLSHIGKMIEDSSFSIPEPELGNDISQSSLSAFHVIARKSIQSPP